MYFRINDKLAIGAEVYQTRYSWGHKAYLYRVRTPERDDLCIEKEKITYYNRTWERYEFESILQSLIGKALKHHAITPQEAKTCNDYIDHYQEPNRFGAIAMIAKMGDVFGKNQKESNDWKTRMLKAGLEDKGLIMPEDWDSLDEDTKQARLDGAIAQLK